MRLPHLGAFLFLGPIIDLGQAPVQPHVSTCPSYRKVINYSMSASRVQYEGNLLCGAHPAHLSFLTTAGPACPMDQSSLIPLSPRWPVPRRELPGRSRNQLRSRIQRRPPGRDIEIAAYFTYPRPDQLHHIRESFRRLMVGLSQPANLYQRETQSGLIMENNHGITPSSRMLYQEDGSPKITWSRNRNPIIRHASPILCVKALSSVEGVGSVLGWL